MTLAVAATTPTRPLEASSFIPSLSPSSKSSPHRANTSGPWKPLESEYEPQSSPRCYTFTPQRAKSVPRAWERRPATPYIQRNETQKIWKRVPLGALTTNTSEARRRGEQPVNFRTVKRLRVGPLDGVEDKENIDYIASKWEEDGMMVLSPKRKAVVHGGSVESEAEIDDDHEMPPEVSSDVEVHAKPLYMDRSTGSAFTALSEDQNFPETSSDMRSVEVDGGATPTVLGHANLLGQDEEITQSRTSAAELITTDSAPLSTSNPSQGDRPVEVQTDVPSPSADTVPIGPSIELVNFSTDHDDTAYLHDFLTRARAQKVVKRQSLEMALSDTCGTMEMRDECPEERTSSRVEDLNDTRTLMTPPQNDGEDLQLSQEMESNVSSLSRRSSRLSTSLPRLQNPRASLPGNISLKRLNGTEFIATHRESRSVAVTTRTNTKRNKGNAVSVQIKLMQLHAEAKAGHEEDDAQYEEARKRKKKSKEVTWDEMIARYQDGSVARIGPEEKETPEDAVAEGDTHKDEQETQEPVLQVKKHVKKVRKLRKLNVGTVNGTPAPRRSISIPVSVKSSYSSEKAMDMTGDVNLGEQVGDANEREMNLRIQTRTRARKSS
ncbi:uncharacterized protein Z518_08042 [Rhinocladiella mackenziei CBS 650.93]|uniref:Uncharacterized protein n=1 Tax=Rhinocladiella mackenziei CBS 650.93 TaxID=1442369 RepID=A0A0D2GV07_9EURO|nr:uncharacterized protein Z518_08042 [Rhinocladiella mackenziei CBS 650.93]KIX02103.1 hypothetical protein Z518_08042 [Rhinocladiella mackenziei CBS 650.93]